MTRFNSEVGGNGRVRTPTGSTSVATVGAPSTASLSGGSKSSRYYASVGLHDKEDDVIKANSSERYTGSMYLDNTFNRWLTRIVFFQRLSLRPHLLSGRFVTRYNTPYTTSRAIPAYNADGTYYYYKRKVNGYSEYNYNILNELENSYKKQVTNSFTVNANLQFTFADWFARQCHSLRDPSELPISTATGG